MNAERPVPTIDIIMPAYNAAAFLAEAIDSVELQTFTDWRIILVDDGSKDDTSEIAQSYKKRLGDKMLYVRQENAGLPAARNSAIRHSNAEYLALLDADDTWLPQRLERTLAPLRERPEVGIVYGFVSRTNAASEVVQTFATPHTHAEGRIARYIYMRTINLPCPTLTFRRTCIEKVGLFDETMRATEDRDLWLRIAQHYEVALVPEVIAHYRISPQGMTTDTDRMLRAQLQFLNKHLGTPGCGRLERRVALSWTYRQRAETLWDRGYRRRAFGSALRSFLYWPFAKPNARTLVSLGLRSIGLWKTQPFDENR